MGQRHRARAGQAAAAADQGGDRAGMVRSHERGGQRQRPGGRQPAGHRPDRGQLQRLVGAQLGQQADQPLGQHRLAGAGRPDQHQVVPAGRRDLQSQPAVVLPDHVQQIRGPLGRRGHRVSRPGQPQVAGQPAQHLVQAGRPEHRQLLDQRGLGQGERRDHHPPRPGPAGGEQAGQHAAHRAQPPVQGQLADQHRAVQLPLGHRAAGREHPAGQGQVEVRAGLGQRRGRQGQGDPPVRPGAPGVHHRRAHPVLGLVQRRVRQPDQVHPGQPVADVRLDLHQPAVDPVQGHRPGPGQRHQNAAG